MPHRFTRRIRAAQARDKPYKVFDTRGLFVRVDTRGQRSWRLRYRFRGAEKLLSLRPYPAVSFSSGAEYDWTLGIQVPPSPSSCSCNRHRWKAAQRARRAHGDPRIRRYGARFGSKTISPEAAPLEVSGAATVCRQSSELFTREDQFVDFGEPLLIAMEPGRVRRTFGRSRPRVREPGHLGTSLATNGTPPRSAPRRRLRAAKCPDRAD